jgi:hypothetical protein
MSFIRLSRWCGAMTELLGRAAGRWAGKRRCQEPGESGARVGVVLNGERAGRLRGRVQCPPAGGGILDTDHGVVEQYWQRCAPWREQEQCDGLQNQGSQSGMKEDNHGERESRPADVLVDISDEGARGRLDDDLRRL